MTHLSLGEYRTLGTVCEPIKCLSNELSWHQQEDGGFTLPFTADHLPAGLEIIILSLC